VTIVSDKTKLSACIITDLRVSIYYNMYIIYAVLNCKLLLRDLNNVLDLNALPQINQNREKKNNIFYYRNIV